MTVGVTHSSDRTRLTGRLQRLQIQPSTPGRWCRGLFSFPSCDALGASAAVFSQFSRRLSTVMKNWRLTSSRLNARTRRYTQIGCYISLALTGCARQSSRMPTAVTPATRSPVTVDSTSRASDNVLDIYRPGTIRYDYRLASTIQSVAGDSIPRTDTTRVSAILTGTFNGDGVQQVIDATVKADSILIATQSATVPAPPIQTQFVPLRVDRVTGRIVSPRSTITECNQETIDFVFRGDEIIPAIRQNGSAAQSWADTTVSEVCRGGLRLQLTRIARYRVEATQGAASGTTVLRVSDVRVAGNGLQWQQAVQASGDGTAIDTLAVGGNPPRVQRISGVTRVNLEFRSPMRTQRFLQTSTASTVMRTP